ncbi:MAG: hypothetical protein ACXAD7_18405 [Candidatus Kariarchaeaceae archaeon]|jgi:hypothetical protein
MMQNKALLWLGLLFVGIGDIFWLGAVFFPDQIADFILIFSPDITSSDLNQDGLTVLRVMTGIMGTLLWLVGILLIPLSKQYNTESRRWILIGVIAWFLGDSLISLITDFEFNILLNLLLLLPILVVLFRNQPSE